MGYWDRQKGLEFSVALRIAICIGQEEPKYDSKKFRSDEELDLLPADKGPEKLGSSKDGRFAGPKAVDEWRRIGAVTEVCPAGKC